MGEKRFSKVSVVLLVPDLILSIICAHVLFLFLVVFFFYKNLKKKFKKNLKFSTKKKKKKTKIFYFVSSFIFLEDYMDYDISLFI